MKINLLILTALVLPSCLVINHKKHVLNLEKVGDSLRPVRTDGYYYCEKEETTFPYVKNQYNGYDQDSSKPYKQKQIEPLTLYKDGSLLTFGISTGFQDNH